jgi:hypothetical protein
LVNTCNSETFYKRERERRGGEGEREGGRREGKGEREGEKERGGGSEIERPTQMAREL